MKKKTETQPKPGPREFTPKIKMLAHRPEVMFLRVAAGSATLDSKDGKEKIEIEIATPIAGAGAILQVSQGKRTRYYSTDLESLLRAAVDDFLEFPPEPRS